MPWQMFTTQILNSDDTFIITDVRLWINVYCIYRISTVFSLIHDETNLKLIKNINELGWRSYILFYLLNNQLTN
jgi:hypothetical protein